LLGSKPEVDERLDANKPAPSRPKRPDTEEMDLFFRALFRLGIWAGDLETWYGTKPLAG